MTEYPFAYPLRFSGAGTAIGAKGVGESPNVGGVSAFSNAVHDAFKAFGLTQAHMPHDHWRVWKIAKDLGLHN